MLQTEEGDDDEEARESLLATPKPKPLTLSGPRILLLWLPAICDLTGTTVRTAFLYPLHEVELIGHCCCSS
jgi:hypothetical protein